MMKGNTQDLLDAAMAALNQAPETNRRIYANGLFLRDFYQNHGKPGKSNQETFDLLIGELSSNSNDPLEPFRGISNPVMVLNCPAFEDLGGQAIFEKLEATAIFKESFALVEPLVAEVRRFEALLEAERRATEVGEPV